MGCVFLSVLRRRAFGDLDIFFLEIPLSFFVYSYATTGKVRKAHPVSFPFRWRSVIQSFPDIALLHHSPKSRMRIISSTESLPEMPNMSIDKTQTVPREIVDVCYHGVLHFEGVGYCCSTRGPDKPVLLAH